MTATKLWLALLCIVVSLFAETAEGQTITAESIATYISLDSGRPKDQYSEYSAKLATLLAGYSPAALERIFGKVVSVDFQPTLNTELGLEPMNFGSLSSVLTPGAEAELDKVFEYLQENPGARIMIEGHTDANLHYDQALSEARAASAAAYLASRGIDSSRLETVGYANNRPLIEGNSKEARDANRRIEIRVL